MICIKQATLIFISNFIGLGGQKVQKNDLKKNGREKALHALLLLIFSITAAEVLVFTGFSSAAKLPILENAGACMGCHDSRDAVMVFKDKGKMSVFVM